MKFKKALKKFAYETFRPRSGEEYAELITGGRGGEAKTAYPWFYFRVFLLFLAIFSVLCICYSASFINLFTLAFAGGIFGDLVFIILLYELYPGRDISLLGLLVVLLTGGIIATAYSTLLYSVKIQADFAAQAWTAFVEETGKALVTVLILLVIKKRNPMCCLIIGAAVGGGYSAFENMWYMFTDGLAYGGVANLSNAIQTALWRSLGTPFSHAAWAGAFGWALSGEKPFKKWQPYAVFAFNYVMHFFVNFPLTEMFSGWKGYPISAVTGILSVSLIIFLIIRTRRAELADLSGALPGGDMAADYVLGGEENCFRTLNINIEDGAGRGGAEKYRYIANVLAMAAIFCFSFMLLGPTCVFGGYKRYKTYIYPTFAEARAVAQDGLVFDYDENREYVEYEDLTQNYAFSYEEGRVVYVEQREIYGEYTYTFCYSNVKYIQFFADNEGRYFVISNGRQVFVDSVDGQPPEEVYLWVLRNVFVETGDGSVYYRHAAYANTSYFVVDDTGVAVKGEEYNYFIVSPKVASLTVYSDGTCGVSVREDVPVRKVESIVFTCIFGVAAIAAGAGYAVYKKKARRFKNA